MGHDAVRSPEPVYTVLEKPDKTFDWKRGETYRTGDENRLRQIYPALKRYVLWKESDPRWIYYNSIPPDQKDGGFTAYVLYEMEYLKQITAALRLPAARVFWRAQSQALTALYHQRFWPHPTQQAHKFYPDTGRREWGNRLGMLHGWALPPGTLTPAETAYLRTEFRASFPQDMPFLGPDILGFPRYGKMMREVWRQGLTHEAAMMAEAGMREVTLGGEFAETYVGGFPAQPSGVLPSMGGAAHLLDGVFWHNGLDFGDGLPRLVAPEHPGGIRNLRFLIPGRCRNEKVAHGEAYVRVFSIGAAAWHRSAYYTYNSITP